MPITLNTPNYGFDTPIEGGDDDVWGGSLNDNWTALDTLLKDTIDTLRQEIADANEAAIEASRIKVGDLYFSGDAAEPAAKLGYGTWVTHGAGRAIVGVGSNGESFWTPDQERGSENHTLSTAEMPTHAHGVTDPGHNHGVNDPGHAHSYSKPVRSSTRGQAADTTQYLVSPTDTGATTVAAGTGIWLNGAATGISTQNNGSSGAHNNIQPSIGVYVWKRTE